MTTMASEITSLTVVYSTVYSDTDQRKHQSSVSLAFVWEIHRDRWIPRTKGQLRGKCFHLMTSSWELTSHKTVLRIHFIPHLSHTKINIYAHLYTHIYIAHILICIYIYTYIRIPLQPDGEGLSCNMFAPRLQNLLQLLANAYHAVIWFGDIYWGITPLT